MDHDRKAGDSSGMSSLAERVQLLLDTRLDGEKQTSFELRNGLAKGLLGKLARGEKTKPSGQTLQGVAEAFGVTTVWLLGGDDAAPADRTPERSYHPTDRYPSREQAIALLAGIMPQAVLDAVKLHALKSADDPGLEYWLEQIRTLARHRADMAKHVEVQPEETAPGRRR